MRRLLVILDDGLELEGDPSDPIEGLPIIFYDAFLKSALQFADLFLVNVLRDTLPFSNLCLCRFAHLFVTNCYLNVIVYY